jgi:enamine deaminase RidA (YjgF/YER057c/UK114 family)
MGSHRRLVSSGSAFEATMGYSRAVVEGPFAWVSGTTGYDYATMTISPDAAVQADQALANIEVALNKAGFAMADVVRVRYLLTGKDHFDAIVPVLGKWFGDIRPAATLEVVGLLDEAMHIEVEVTAYKTES